MNNNGFYKDRILYLVDKYYDGNGAKFLRDSGLSHNYLQRLKSQVDPEPSVKAVNQIIEAIHALDNSFNPLWLIRDEEALHILPNNSVAMDSVEYNSKIFAETIAAIERIEHAPNTLKEMKLPVDFELQLAKLLAMLLRNRLRD